MNLKHASILPLLLCCAFAPACNDNTFEDAGEKVDEAVDTVDDTVDDAVDEVDDAVDTK